MVKFDEAVIDRWRIFLEDQSADTNWMEHRDAVDQRRILVQQEILELLNAFLTGSVSPEDLKVTFDKKTRNEWSVFGLKGPSGAMFLNMLVKHISDEDALAANLKQVLPVPGDEKQGRDRMTAFGRYLLDLIKSGAATKQKLHTARVPFFVSGWWHLQDTERWPIFYDTARKTFAKENLTKAHKNPIDEYFDFRVCYLTLAKALGLKTWEFEHVCAWYDRHGPGKPPEESPPPTPPPQPPDIKDVDTLTTVTDIESTSNGTPHTHTQWLLATIGRALGCRIWIAKNDHGKEWNGKPLGALSLNHLPNLGMGTDSQKVIELIDVLWLKGANQVAAAFEIEHSTSVYSGLLRMSDLTVLSPNLFFPLYIVAPEERLSKVRKELRRPTFQMLELHKRCGFFSCETLFEQADDIKKWANDPSAIDKLALRIDDTDSDGVD